MNPFYLGELLALGVSVCDAACCSLLNHVEKRAAVFTVNYIKLLFAAAAMTVLRLLFTGALAVPDLPPAALLWLTVSGLIGYVLGDMFYFASFRHIPYRLSMVIFCTHPIVTTLAALLLFRQRITPMQFLGILLTICGTLTALLCGGKNRGTDGGGNRMLGVLFAFLGMLGQGVSVLFSSQAMALMGEFPGKTLLCSQLRQLAAIAGFTVLGFIRRDWPRLRADLHIPHALPLLALGGLSGCAIGTTLLLRSIAFIPIGIASALSSISPILAIPISIVCFKDRIRLPEILGVCVTVGGIVLLSL